MKGSAASDRCHSMVQHRPLSLTHGDWDHQMTLTWLALRECGGEVRNSRAVVVVRGGWWCLGCDPGQRNVLLYRTGNGIYVKIGRWTGLVSRQISGWMESPAGNSACMNWIDGRPEGTPSTAAGQGKGRPHVRIAPAPRACPADVASASASGSGTRRVTRFVPLRPPAQQIHSTQYARRHGQRERAGASVRPDLRSARAVQTDTDSD